jgi:hypothetical protein
MSRAILEPNAPQGNLTRVTGPPHDQPRKPHIRRTTAFALTRAPARNRAQVRDHVVPDRSRASELSRLVRSRGATALRTSRQRPLCLNGASAVEKGGLHNQSRSTCSPPHPGSLSARRDARLGGLGDVARLGRGHGPGVARLPISRTGSTRSMRKERSRFVISSPDPRRLALRAAGKRARSRCRSHPGARRATADRSRQSNSRRVGAAVCRPCPGGLIQARRRSPLSTAAVESRGCVCGVSRPRRRSRGAPTAARARDSHAGSRCGRGCGSSLDAPYRREAGQALGEVGGVAAEQAAGQTGRVCLRVPRLRTGRWCRWRVYRRGGRPDRSWSLAGSSSVIIRQRESRATPGRPRSRTTTS